MVSKFILIKLEAKTVLMYMSLVRVFPEPHHRVPSLGSVFAKAKIGPNFGECEPQLEHYGSTVWLHGGHILALPKTLEHINTHTPKSTRR
jgi:hypothetical protein